MKPISRECTDNVTDYIGNLYRTVKNRGKTHQLAYENWQKDESIIGLVKPNTAGDWDGWVNPAFSR